MSEEKFTREFVIPLLRKLGYRRVRYTHGSDECGRDVVFLDKDRLGFDVICAAQVKLGDLKGTQKNRIHNDIVPQLLEGIRTPFHDYETGNTVRIHRMYLMVSGLLKGTAKQQIHALTEKEPNIFVVDKQSIDVFVGGDGFETMFYAKTFTGNISRSLYMSRYPRLPMLAAGTWLEIMLEVEIAGKLHDTSIKILETSYDPLNRQQKVTIGIPTDEDEITDELADNIQRQLEEWFAYTGGLLDDDF